jgi:hypothetical protein
MKYQVQISYTNPAHEHISLRRRVDTVTRIVEARTEQEALNRAANQQRALGFMIKEAKVVKPAVLSEEVEQIDEVKLSPEAAKRAAGAVKGAKNLAGEFAKYKAAQKKLKSKKTNEEVEQVDEANMRFDPEAAARPKSSDVKNFQMRDTNRRAAAASKKYIRRMTKLGGLGPNQTKKDTEAHMKAHFGEETGADKRDSGYKMSSAVRAAQKKSDELSKEKPKHQAGTLAAKNVREEKANVNNSKDKLKLLKDRVKNKVKTANMSPLLDITGK